MPEKNQVKDFDPSKNEKKGQICALYIISFFYCHPVI